MPRVVVCQIMRLVFEIFIFSCLLLKEVNCTGGAPEMNALQKKLFQGYSPLVRPSRNYSIPTNVRIGLYLSVIMGLEWTDELLQWDPKHHGGIDRIVSLQSRIWKPDLILHTAASEQDNLGNEHVFIRVNSKGVVRWEPTFYLESTCKLDVSKYPFDVSVCPIEIAAWMSDNKTILLRLPDNPINFQYMSGNSEFEISSAGARKIVTKFESLFFERIQFNIRLARRPTYVIISLLLPINLLAVLSILSFLMPPEEQGKVNMSVTILLSFTVFLSFIDNNMPPNSDTVSLLVVYTFTLLLMSFLSVVGNILVITISRVVSAQDEHTRVCNVHANKKLPATESITELPATESITDTSKTMCSSKSGQDFTEEGTCDSCHSGSVRTTAFVSGKRTNTGKRSTGLANQLNRAFFIICATTFVFISCLMLALLITV